MWPNARDAAIILAAHAALAAAQCPQIHVFGARETTAPVGTGSAGQLITMIVSEYPGTTSEAINYPACGGQSTCGDVSYAASVVQGTSAVVSQVEAFNEQCPQTELILVGYSQGGQIMDNAVCGGGDPGEGLSSTAVPLSTAALAMIKAVILMGDPRYEYGESYEVGTCTAGGFDARPAGFTCPHATLIQSYCDSQDPYCCNGDDAAHHQEYVSIYGSQAMTFIEGKIGTSGTGGGGGGGTGTGPTGGSCSAMYGQCGGIGWTGATCCSSGTCQASNSYYSQCL